MTSSVRTWALALALGGCVSVAQARFADPLDTPATPSALAAHGLFNDLTWAGDRVIAVGQRGHVLYSDDRGSTWTQASVPVQSDLTAVNFADAEHGWAVGHDGIVLASNDGGRSWRKQLDGRDIGPLMARYYQAHPPAGESDAELARLHDDIQRFVSDGPDKPLLDVWFQDARHGYVVGAFNLVLRTDDGGQTWLPCFDRTDNPKLLHLYAIHAIGSGLYIAGEQGLLLKLDVAAQRFRALPVPYQGTLFGVTGDADALLVFGLRGNVFRSVDEGLHWSQIETDVPLSLMDATRGSNGDLILLAQNGQLLALAHDSARLVGMATSQRAPAAALLMLDRQHALLAGPQGLQRISLSPAAAPSPP